MENYINKLMQLGYETGKGNRNAFNEIFKPEKKAKFLEATRIQELETAKKMEEECGVEKCSNCGGDFDGGNCYWCKAD